MRTRTRLMVAAVAIAVVSSLAAGCDHRDGSGVAAGHPNPDARASRTTTAPAATPTRTPKHRPAKKRRTAHPRPTAHHSHRAHPTPRTTAHPTKAPAPGVSALGTTAERAVVRLVNAERAKAGCAPLRTDARLREAAYLHSRDMGLHHYFDHNSQNGETPWDRIRAAGYTQPSAENIASGQPTPAAVMDAWMHSAGHRANILSCTSKAIGVGLWKSGGAVIWTQDFGFA